MFKSFHNKIVKKKHNMDSYVPHMNCPEYDPFKVKCRHTYTYIHMHIKRIEVKANHYEELSKEPNCIRGMEGVKGYFNF